MINITSVKCEREHALGTRCVLDACEDGGVGVPSTEEVSKPVLYSPVSQQQNNLCTVDMHTNPVHLRSSSSITIQHPPAPRSPRACRHLQYAHAHAIPKNSPRRATSPSTWTPPQHSTRTPFGTPCDVSQYLDAAAAQYADTFRYTSVYASMLSVAPSQQYAHARCADHSAKGGGARA